MPNEPIIQPIRLKGVISAGLDFIPIVGNAKALVEAAIGRDPITGRKLESWERGASAAAILGGPLVKGVKHAGKAVAGIVASGSKAKNKTVNLAKSPTPTNPPKQQTPSQANKEASATTASPAKAKEQGTVTKINQNQSKVIDDVEAGKISLKTNKHKGNYGEMKMDVHYESKGYDRISDGRVESLDDKIIKGIDGVYENSNPPPQFIIAEAKYGSGKLGKTKDGPQMSEDWIQGSNRLENAVGKEKADEILEAMMFDPDNVQKSLIHVDEKGNVIESILDSAEKAKK